MVSWDIAAAAAVLATLVILALRRSNRRTLPLPPGPRPLPLIGNLLDIPKEEAWLAYRSWNDQYGDVVYVEALGQKMVILGSATAVRDLLERRSAIYSDRPITPMAKLMKFDWSFISLPYGDVWRRKRRMMYSHMNRGASVRFHPVQVISAYHFARNLLASEMTPESLHSSVSLYLGQMLIKAVYGIDVEDEQSQYIQLPQKLVNNFAKATVPGSFMIDLLPFLKYVPAWVPGAGFQRLAKSHIEMQRRALDAPIERIEAEMAEGAAPPSMAQEMLEEDSERVHHEDIKDVAGLAYVGGNDTTGAVVLSFFLAMVLYPDVQAKAQAEIDRVVGKDRMPEFADEPDLPYVQAVVNECLRWLPMGPMGIPHRLTRDDEYKGYHIPKGTIVIGLVWSILHNTDDYPDPERFMPERYLTPEGTLDSSVRNPRTACFGSGRRICPGQHVADATLFITVATLLATVEIVRTKDANGVEIVPEVAVTSELVSHAKPFPWAARPRSWEAAALLATTIEMTDLA